MSDGPSLETYANHANSTTNSSSQSHSETPSTSDGTLKRTLLFISICAVSAGLAYAVVRATLVRPPADPTTERIQQLIDEANRLLKQLDEQKPE